MTPKLIFIRATMAESTIRRSRHFANLARLTKFDAVSRATQYYATHPETRERR
jgi:hypothetical protein